MFKHYKWVKIEIANRRFLATRSFFQIWKSWLWTPLSRKQCTGVGLHKKVKSNTRWTSFFLPLDFTFFTVGLHFKLFKKNIGLHRRKCTNMYVVKSLMWISRFPDSTICMLSVSRHLLSTCSPHRHTRGSAVIKDIRVPASSHTEAGWGAPTWKQVVQFSEAAQWN